MATKNILAAQVVQAHSLSHLRFANGSINVFVNQLLFFLVEVKEFPRV
jgi:hypothetical protein